MFTTYFEEGKLSPNQSKDLFSNSISIRHLKFIIYIYIRNIDILFISIIVLKIKLDVLLVDRLGPFIRKILVPLKPITQSWIIDQSDTQKILSWTYMLNYEKNLISTTIYDYLQVYLHGIILKTSFNSLGKWGSCFTIFLLLL